METDNIGQIGKTNPKPAENSLIWIIVIVFLAVILFVSMKTFHVNFGASNLCNDGTAYGECSKTKPYYCSQGIIIEKPSVCFCPETFNLSNDGNECISDYQKGSKNLSLKYILNREEGKINLVVYEGFSNYTSKIPRSIEYIGNGKNFSRIDFKLKSINNEIQKDALSNLVKEIQKITSDKDEQAKIAISIVQNIPYGSAEGTIFLTGREVVDYTRYPYEVLFDNQGICGEKSQLLAFLLRELGYGTAIFYNQQENHESIGIKCPLGKSWHNSGYCFVETSGPAIISDSSIEYVGGLKITSQPEVMEISDGFTLSKNLDEYDDAQEMAKIREKISENGEINYFDSVKMEKLRQKYGLDREYNLV